MNICHHYHHSLDFYSNNNYPSFYWTAQDRYHTFVLFFITLNLLICALQVLYLGLSDDYQLGGGELLSGELLLFLPPGILFLVSNIWFLIIITATVELIESRLIFFYPERIKNG